MDIDRDAIVRVFVAETEEGLASTEQALVALESQPDDEETLGAIFRVFHTLKGNAASLGFERLAEFAHVVEDLLDRLRDGTLAVSADLTTLLLQAVDALRRLLPDAVAGRDDAPRRHRALLRRLAAAAERKPRRAEAKRPRQPEPGPEPLKPERRLGPGRRSEDASGERSQTLRVEIEKLDRMLTLTGEIAVARGRLTQILEDLRERVGEAAIEAHREADRLYAELQEQVMKVRLVPVGPSFRQLTRVVRDLCASHGKQARLVLEGEDVELDTAVIELLRDPLTHMIRNALDHGIEPPDERKAAGKDPCGRISLCADHAAGNVVVQLSDDGAGLNRQRIRERARAHGLVADPDVLSDHDLDRLVLAPGLSTAASVTSLSGRGVGMDVVRRNVEALRGSLQIDSREGHGTTLTIRLPLTLAIIDGFGVGVADETFVIPLDSVVECIALAPEECGRRERSGVISLRGQPLPFLRLRELFELGGSSAAPARESVVIVQHDGAHAGLAVDTLHGSAETVIKPLGPLFRRLPGISGSAILGNGRVALILDLPALFREVLSSASPDRF